MLVNHDEPFRLSRDEGHPYYLKATQHFHTGLGTGKRRRDWKVYTEGYAYTISEDPDLGHELLAWHWHPTTRLDTHIHIGKSHPTHGDLAKYHVPSGRVSFEQVVRFLITDLGVSPARADWDSVLTDSHGKFVTHRRWSNSSAIADPPEPN